MSDLISFQEALNRAIAKGAINFEAACVQIQRDPQVAAHFNIVSEGAKAKIIKEAHEILWGIEGSAYGWISGIAQAGTYDGAMARVTQCLKEIDRKNPAYVPAEAFVRNLGHSLQQDKDKILVPVPAAEL